MKELVRLGTRPSRDGKSYNYLLDYVDQAGKRKRISLGHTDRRKAERQRAQKERNLRMGIFIPEPMRLSEFCDDSLIRTGGQIRPSTAREYGRAVRDLIKAVGNINYQTVSLRHGELFVQTWLDEGNAPATVAKKLRHLKRLFTLAVHRKQLDENPLARLSLPKSPRKKVHTYKPQECERILKAAREFQAEGTFNQKTSISWDLFITVALTTAMRRGELLNTIWSDIDFEKETIEVSPKTDTDQTWQWHIKDTDRRTLPLTEEVVVLLSQHQSRQPEGYPYVFVPTERYDHIQELRKESKWDLCNLGHNVLNNFTRQFRRILKRAGVRTGQFHDFRRTALSNWLTNGMSTFDIMRLAGHSSFDTTYRFYVAVADDLNDRARAATTDGIGKNLARAWHAPPFLNERH